MSVRLLDPAAAVLGEGPLWVAEESALYWVDIKGRRLNRFRTSDGQVLRWSMPAPLAWIVSRTNAPGFVAGLGREIGLLKVGDGVNFAPKCEIEPEQPGNRLNDAKADQDGNIRFGTMDNSESTASGAFYTLCSDFSLFCEDRGYVIANGPAMSPQGNVIYHTDSAARTIYRFYRQYDGHLGGREVFVRFDEADGYPDGMTTDAQGGLWVAHWGGGRVTRFLPDGTRERSIALPVSQVTSCAFGGAGLDRLFVTSAAIGLVDEPLAGALFEVEPGVAGLLPHRFTG
ncbi:MAG TPA: SMP-30/gluconolactonase/LRE family protein [Acidocella sp.]|nr:SMP-30/gluconolactonase/LRE family protein [Acidocella sp.]